MCHCIGWLHPEAALLPEELLCPYARHEAEEPVPVSEPYPYEPPVRLGSVRKSIGGDLVLDNVTFEVERSEILGIVGRAGAGKSTLIRCLNGLEKPDRGRVEILGRDIVPLPERELRSVRGQVGTMFEKINLLSTKTVAQNIALPLKIAGFGRAKRDIRVRELLDLIDLPNTAELYPAQLSAEQKQRVGIARALAVHPTVLVSDEPTSTLDPEAALSILALLRDLNHQFGLTIVLATREMSVVRTIADRVIVLEQGRVLEEGETWRVFAAPEAEVTQRLIQVGSHELPLALHDQLSHEWIEGTHLVLRLQLAGGLAQRPVLAEMARDLNVFPIVLHAAVQHVQQYPMASFVVAIEGACEPLTRRVGEYLASRVSQLEVLGYARQLA